MAQYDALFRQRRSNAPISYARRTGPVFAVTWHFNQSLLKSVVYMPRLGPVNRSWTDIKFRGRYPIDMATARVGTPSWCMLQEMVDSPIKQGFPRLKKSSFRASALSPFLRQPLHGNG
ncbi:hypothetical protein HRR83_005047 [Exophiala dermatitidis]|uniref:Uncharacterized protein n=1 Tax=Exophiala dermatitidis TaxID=5970 RepID=A0AAN6IUE0_EXODE|nr:hypothetical protein HRR74_004789 [Exophiala dermatitidis]KAJ4519783.1 hypothetical protein HRR73_003843 [Exophiala dermatitidis]KAJ4534414.1 hypothetical protein HRR76_006339 [Exophiala dermatitidis]KAJ4541364.1 hypothetical protein HRR77_006161 [Exophiala dermatitidis]KAJ4564090.1 hypothetical protein HRR79_006116 [Exophiala dermatitidis]